MENITYITDEQGVEHVIIDNADGSFTSMTKAHWDKLEAEREQSGTL
jgi:hypothetical protein